MSVTGPDGLILRAPSKSLGGDPLSRQVHDKDDVDFDRSAHHHTLGYGPMQAAPGGDFTEYALYAPALVPDSGAYAVGVNAPTCTFYWHEVKGDIIFYGSLIFGAASLGTAVGCSIVVPVSIHPSQIQLGVGRESQVTGVQFNLTKSGSNRFSFNRYDNAGIIANSRQFHFAGSYRKA